MKKKLILTLSLMLVVSLAAFTSCKKEESSDTPAGSAEQEVVAESMDDQPIGDPQEEEPLPDPEDEEEGSEGNAITFPEEEEGATIDRVTVDPSKFYGSWTAPSDVAEHLYGNVEISVNSDGTWSGVLTDEKIGGKWTNEGDHIHLQSKVFGFDLAFDASGKLIMIEKSSGGELHTVLVRK